MELHYKIVRSLCFASGKNCCNGTRWESSHALIDETDQFVRTSQGQACDERWASWPATQAAGVASGNVLRFRIFPAIGNLFLTLGQMMQVIIVTPEILQVNGCNGQPCRLTVFEIFTVRRQQYELV